MSVWPKEGGMRFSTTQPTLSLAMNSKWGDIPLSARSDSPGRMRCGGDVQERPVAKQVSKKNEAESFQALCLSWWAPTFKDRVDGKMSCGADMYSGTIRRHFKIQRTHVESSFFLPLETMFTNHNNKIKRRVKASLRILWWLLRSADSVHKHHWPFRNLPLGHDYVLAFWWDRGSHPRAGWTGCMSCLCHSNVRVVSQVGLPFVQVTKALLVESVSSRVMQGTRIWTNR